MKNKFLKTIEQKLQSTYHITFMDSNVLFLREEKDAPVMGQVICVNDSVLVSVATDYKNPAAIAHMIFDLMHIAPISIAEPFYESFNGQMCYGERALEVEILENTNILESCPSANVKPI